MQMLGSVPSKVTGFAFLRTATNAKKKQDDIRAKQKEEAKQQVFAQEAKKQEATFEVDEEAAKKQKMRERKSRATITGFSEEDQQKVLMGLLAACHQYDMVELEKGLGEAIAQGIDPCDTLDRAQDLFQKMSTEEFLTEKMQELQAELKTDNSAQALRSLQNIMKQAKRLGVATDAVHSAKESMQHGVRLRARKTLRGSIFHRGVEMEEMELVDTAFSDISAFEGLKSAQEWRGHQKASLLTAAENKEQTMLCHSKQEIRDALTKVASSEARAAVSNFRSILGWMGDRPLPECQRMGYTEDIIGVARSSQSLADEVYVQVVKQLRDNPSPRSVLLGWKLLLRLCQQVRPSDKLEEFIRSFAMHQVNSSNHEVSQVAKQCVSDLNINVAPDKPRPEGDVELIPITAALA
ncbi:unnamed protein product [Symbiodinium natans]|uniref:MyTH4 domain-containing protein n=1 Tax=Symbiodinium natans TaxID=878477 RepID=A0A812MJZ1_9DINO|nr:unnamed protein product [Symbiodinium natans]